MLHNIKIKNFKKFAELDLQNFSRVNVFVGNNNSGKSTVLEAILFAVNDFPLLFLDRALRRAKLLANPMITIENDLDYLFNLASVDKKITLSFEDSLKKHEVVFNKDVLFNHIQDMNQVGGRNSFLKLLAEYEYDNDKVQLVVDTNTGNVQISNINKKLCTINMLDNNLNWNHVVFNKIIIDKHIDDIIEFLNTEFNLQIVKFAVVDNEIYVDNGFDKMIPIRYLGDGIVKIIGMIAYIISSRGGICLIDEIENGIYYKNHPKLIKYLDKISNEFNVQLFVTTHSNDFIRNLDGFSDLALYRLNPKFKGGVMRWDKEIVMEYIDDYSADIR